MTKTVFLSVLLFISVLLGATVKADERRELVDRLIKQLESQDWRDRMSAALSLGNAKRDARHALPALWKAKSDENEKVRKWAANSVEKIYRSLNTGVPVEKLVGQIAKEPPPPKWNRIPAYVHEGDRLAEGLKYSGLAFGGPKLKGNAQKQQRKMFLGGWLEIRIPLPYAKISHARFVGKDVALGKNAGLDVVLTKGYVPQLWEEREIVAAKTLAGEFEVVRLPKLPQDRKWLIIYDDLKNGFDLDRDGNADITVRVAPSDFQR